MAPRAQSETVGVVILVGVFAVTALLVGTFVIGNVTDQAGDEPLTALNVTATPDNVTLVHGGGDTLDTDDVDVILRQAGTDERRGLPAFSELTGNGDGRFESGERRRDSHPFGAGSFRVTVVHTASNTVLLDETVDARLSREAVPLSNIEPRPRFDVTPAAPSTGESVTLDATNSTDPDGTITNYEWAFDDGATATGQTVSHTYSSGGTYTVRLRVTDNASASNSTTQQVTVTGSDTTAPTAVAGSNRTIAEDTSVDFDGSASSDNVGIDSYTWDFGDGTTATGSTPTHTYDDPGTYTVELTVEDAAGNTDTDTLTVTVTDRPTADISYQPAVPEPGEAVTFDGSGSSDSDGTVQTYAWDFQNDGTTDATGRTVTHTYPSTGNRTVSLTVTDDDGATNATTTVVPVNRPPTANVTYAPDSPSPGESITFDGSNSTDPDGTVEDYAWDWTGDGTTDATGETATHSYGAAGQYDATLTVTDDDGVNDTETRTVTVNDGPTARFGVTCSAGECEFDASNSTDDGSIVEYAWAFGDGSPTATTTDPVLNHTYTSGGTYTVTLTVTDDLGATDTVSRDVTVETVDAALSITPSSATTAETVQIDASGSSSTGGTIVAYNVSLDDGRTINTTSATLSYTFDCAGTYNVSVTVTDDQGATDTAATTVDITTATREPIAAVNAGGGQITSCEGVTYAADSGQYLVQGGGETYTSGASDVAGSPDDALYLTERYESTSPLEYGFPSGNGTYRVTLKFAEVYFGTAGPDGTNQRVFDVSVEGVLVADNLDLYGEVGPNTRYDVQRTVSVTDGALNVTLGREVENPKIGAILVERIDDPPTASISYAPGTPTPGEQVTFDGSNSADPEGPIASYAWDFGDGTTATGATPTHTYASAGSYDVTLTVTDTAGYTDSTTTTVTVNDPPTASFTYSPAQPGTGEQVTFDASGSADSDGTIQTYAWDFDGDGTTDATGETATTTYASAGDYDVTLTVTDDDGATNATTQTVSVTAVTAAFSTSPSPIHTNEMVTFTDQSTANGETITSYEWTFGDGTTATGQNPTHRFDAPGRYDVTLTVTTDVGTTVSTSQTLEVGGLVAGGTQTVDGGTTDSVAVLDISNNASTAFDVTALTIADTLPDSTQLREPIYSISGYGDAYEVLIDGDLSNGFTHPPDGRAELGEFQSGFGSFAFGAPHGTAISLTGGSGFGAADPATVAGGTTTQVYLIEFQNGADAPVDMSGKQVTVTFEIEYADGVTDTETITVSL